MSMQYHRKSGIRKGKIAAPFGYASPPDFISAKQHSAQLMQPINANPEKTMYTIINLRGGKKKLWTISTPNISRNPSITMTFDKTHQLIFGFGRLGLNRIYRTPETTRKAGTVVKSNTTCTFLSLVQWIGWRMAIVAFTWSKNLQEARIHK